MRRQIVYPGSIPQDTDLLLTNKHAMIALGYLIQAVMGTGARVDGLACTPTTPAGMTVNVGPGSIHSIAPIDATAYGSLAADTTHQIMKQGILLDTVNLPCPAPAGAGQSVVYLVQAAFQEVDGGSTILPYYNASNPAVPYSGPNNSGTPNNTVRQGNCAVSVKAGVAATTGTQATPAPDAGYLGLYAITVANGASTITSGNIAVVLGAPFIGPKLPNIIPAVQSGAAIFAVDTSGSANTIAFALNPALTALTAGTTINVKVANTNTGPVVINAGLGGVAAIRPDASDIPSNTLHAGGVYQFTYDGSHWQFGGQSGRVTLIANITFFIATTGSDTNPGTSGQPWLTRQHAANYISQFLDLAGFNVTVQMADGTYNDALLLNNAWVGGGPQNVIFNGNSVTPSNVAIATTTDANRVANTGSGFTIQNCKISTTSAGGALVAGAQGVIYYSNIEFGACAAAHIHSSYGSQIYTNGNNEISGSAPSHVLAEENATISLANATMTLTGTPAFSGGFASCSNNATISISAETFSGSATGTRYAITGNGVISTGGAGATYLPGNASGTTATGGQYV